MKDPEQFKALYAYLPYHHVEDGTKYPAVLMLTGANDGRVAPYHLHLLSLENDRRNLERVRDIDLYGLPKDYYQICWSPWAAAVGVVVVGLMGAGSDWRS